ncbi:MAG TPA: mannitol dehydrogenase [Candidatus Limiplasma sp.]|nr:mannitol dehydrogenase [Candidatus Limiplasma sp.]HRX09660.1 mannitol dehydrogenase [Candidatus Limiplasma sp.]
MQENYALMIGAGNIGRGFIGQLFSEWGFPVVFSDVNETLTGQINEYGEYPVVQLTDASETAYTVRRVRAIDGSDASAVAQAVAGAAIAAVSVGSGALKYVAPGLAKGIALRCERKAPPLNILICENLLDAQKFMIDLLSPLLDAAGRAYLASHIGLVETSVGRMIPVQTEAMRAVHPLAVFAESYCELPADKAAFKGGVPEYPHLKPYAPFTFYVQRKMFVHNMGHSAVAYLGMNKGYEFIWQAMEDSDIRNVAHAAMLESCAALARAYHEDLAALTAHADDLFRRFGNRKLMDTVQRVGRDLPRKLGENERFFGAARLCQAQGVPCPAIRACIRSIIGLDADQDASLDTLRAAADELIASKHE